jgi:hypothetical protein
MHTRRKTAPQLQIRITSFLQHVSFFIQLLLFLNHDHSLYRFNVIHSGHLHITNQRNLYTYFILIFSFTITTPENIGFWIDAISVFTRIYTWIHTHIHTRTYIEITKQTEILHEFRGEHDKALYIFYHKPMYPVWVVLLAVKEPQTMNRRFILLWSVCFNFYYFRVGTRVYNLNRELQFRLEITECAKPLGTYCKIATFRGAGFANLAFSIQIIWLLLTCPMRGYVWLRLRGINHLLSVKLWRWMRRSICAQIGDVSSFDLLTFFFLRNIWLVKCH